MENKNIMSYEAILPQDFDGTFKFTNWTDEDFVATWGKKQYTFPAGTTSPILIMEHTPLEIQSIRKKFAKDLAEREYFKSQEYQNGLKRERNSDGSPRGYGNSYAGSYSLETLTPFIQKCLLPLPTANAIVTNAPMVNTEEKLSRDEDGELNTIAVKQNSDLKEEKKSFRRKALNE